MTESHAWWSCDQNILHLRRNMARYCSPSHPYRISTIYFRQYGYRQQIIDRMCEFWFNSATFRQTCVVCWIEVGDPLIHLQLSGMFHLLSVSSQIPKSCWSSDDIMKTCFLSSVCFDTVCVRFTMWFESITIRPLVSGDYATYCIFLEMIIAMRLDVVTYCVKYNTVRFQVIDTNSIYHNRFDPILSNSH